MTWPFENDTSTIIKKLAKADLKEHKLKTLITAIIIVIATCLMATVFSILVQMCIRDRFCRWYAQPTSEPTEFNLYSETAHFCIWLRLITRHRDYNVYVHYYLKG